MTKPFVLTELRIKVEELLRSTNARLPEAALAPEMG
jgi:DNA-binding response OmpR family regulator